MPKIIMPLQEFLEICSPDIFFKSHVMADWKHIKAKVYWKRSQFKFMKQKFVITMSLFVSIPHCFSTDTILIHHDIVLSSWWALEQQASILCNVGPFAHSDPNNSLTGWPISKECHYEREPSPINTPSRLEIFFFLLKFIFLFCICSTQLGTVQKIN